MIRSFFILCLFLLSVSLSAQDMLLSASGTRSDGASGREGSFKNLARARLNVTGIDKVLVVASFDTKYQRRSTPRDGVYRLSVDGSTSASMQLSLRNNGGTDKGIGSLIHLFDASGLSGNTNFLLEHSSTLRLPVSSSGTLVAIGLTTTQSGVEISHDFVSSTTPVAFSGNLGAWKRVSGVRVSGIELLEQGDVFVSASINSLAEGEGKGEWKLQYRTNNSGWTDFGPTTSQTFTSEASYGISTLSFVLQDLPAGDCSFRLMHSQTEGTPGDLTTYSAQLAACALIYEDTYGITRSFPSFYSQNPEASTSSSSFSPVITQSIDPSNQTDLFIQAQYVMSAETSLDAAGFDLYIDQGRLDGTDQLRYLSSGETGNGGSVGLGSSLQPGTSYDVSLRHQSASGVNLTTWNASLSGFQLSSVGNSVWIGGGLLPTDWDQSDNWIGGVPGSRENAIIPAGAPAYPILLAPTEVQDLTVESGGTFTLEPTSSLTIHGDSDVSGTMTVQSDLTGTASLIVLGSSSGDIAVNNHLVANRWYIVSSPVSGQGFESFLSENEIPYNSNLDHALTDYSELNNTWNAFFPADKSGSFTTGEGYLVRRRTPDGSVLYRGGILNSDLNYGITASGSGWNATGNPFTSAIGVTSDASTIENFLTTNLDQLDPNYSVLYLWDEEPGYSGTQNNYKVIGNAGYVDTHGYAELQLDYLQIGQGFLVKSVDGGGILRYSKEMQIHRNSTGMVKSAAKSWDGFKLLATQGERSESAIVCFQKEMSKGLDVSYDAGLLNSKPGLSVYTHLVEDNPGIGFKIQCLPYQDTSDLVIPVGLDLLSGGEISFSTTGVYLPSTKKIVLEDRLTGTWTDLTSPENAYGVVLEDSTLGTGRFFLHLKDPTATAIQEIFIHEESFYGYCLHSVITIHAKLENEAIAYLMDMTGRTLGTYALQKGERHEISVSSLKQGIYVVAIVNGDKRNVLKILKN